MTYPRNFFLLTASKMKKTGTLQTPKAQYSTTPSGAAKKTNPHTFPRHCPQPNILSLSSSIKNEGTVFPVVGVGHILGPSDDVLHGEVVWPFPRLQGLLVLEHVWFHNLVCWDLLPTLIGHAVQLDKNRFCHGIWRVEIPIAALDFPLPLSNRILAVNLLFKVRKGVTS